ncbi:MAG: hypothetical protein ACOYKE_15505, partial [Ferruginibacter sp.]
QKINAMFEMIDTLNFRVCNLTLPPELFVKETTKAIRYKFEVYQLPCGCFVWCYPSGVRELSALPF